MNDHTPLEIVRANLYRHTPRRPETTDVVLSMMSGSLAELGEDNAAEFVETLCAGLDPAVTPPVRFDKPTIDMATRLADQAADPALDNGRRVGGLAVVSAMGLLYRPRRRPGNAPRSVEVIGAVGRELLAKIAFQTDGEAGFSVDELSRDLMRSNAHVDPMVLAIELLPLVDSVAEATVIQDEDVGAEGEVTDDTVWHERIVARGPMPLSDLELNRTLMDKMDWLRLGGVEAFEAHAIALEGRVIAYVADLTTYHEELYECRQDIERIMPDHFRRRLAVAIATYHVSPGNYPRTITDNQKVPTYYASSGYRNDRVLRIYFTPIGRHVDGTPVIGLLAASRTKARERKVLSVIASVRFDRMRTVE